MLGLLIRPANTCSHPRTAVWAPLWSWNLSAHISASANRRSRVHRILGLFVGGCHFWARIASDSGTVNVEAAVTYLKYNTVILMEELRKIIKIRFGQSLGRDLNIDPPEFGSAVVSTQQQRVTLLWSWQWFWLLRNSSLFMFTRAPHWWLSRTRCISPPPHRVQYFVLLKYEPRNASFSVI